MGHDPHRLQTAPVTVLKTQPGLAERAQSYHSCKTADAVRDMPDVLPTIDRGQPRFQLLVKASNHGVCLVNANQICQSRVRVELRGETRI